jgi:hypothetical protein
MNVKTTKIQISFDPILNLLRIFESEILFHLKNKFTKDTYIKSKLTIKI